MINGSYYIVVSSSSNAFFYLTIATNDDFIHLSYPICVVKRYIMYIFYPRRGGGREREREKKRPGDEIAKYNCFSLVSFTPHFHTGK